jgi:hypothetical protein
MYTAHIDEEHVDENPFEDIQEKTFWSPGEIIGNVVEFDVGGVTGKRIGHVVDVDEDGAVATPMFLDTTHQIGDMVRFPRPGATFSVHEAQRFVGGEWVTEKTFITDATQVDRQVREYDPDGMYRIIDKEYIHGAAEYTILPIRNGRDGIEIPGEDLDYLANPDEITEILGAINDEEVHENDYYLGEVFIDRRTHEEDEDKIVHWSVDHNHRHDGRVCRLGYPEKLIKY